MTRAVSVLAGVLVGAMLLAPAAQAQGDSTIPYEAKLLRLAEVLGSIHYLRNVCGEESNFWRDQMRGLLTAENPEPSRRARLVASFNRGYRTFDSVYSACTEQALAAVDRYMTEGLDLTREINSRYGD